MAPFAAAASKMLCNLSTTSGAQSTVIIRPSSNFRKSDTQIEIQIAFRPHNNARQSFGRAWRLFGRNDKTSAVAAEYEQKEFAI
jgi:hypothetical protein